MKKVFAILFFHTILFVLNVRIVNAQIPSTQGTEFYFSFMRNGYRCQPYPENDKLTVIASAARNCSVTVSNPNTGWSQSHSLTANGVTVIAIPDLQGYNTGSEIIENKGLLVTSTDTISLYIANEATNSFDAANVLPLEALGSHYIVQNISPSPVSCQNENLSCFLIVATEDSTIVDITPKKNTFNGHNANVTFSITLNRGNAYQVFSRPEDLNGDFSGTEIQSRDCKRIAVFNGNVLTGIPSDRDMGVDHIFEQAMPTEYWGKEFAVTASLNRSGDFVRITALENNTGIFINGISATTLNKGETYQFFISASSPSCYITSSRPCAVNLYQTTSFYDNSPLGDPSMVWIAPVEQQIKKITFSTFSAQSITEHYVNIITHTETVNSIQLDNLNVGNQFTPLNGNPELSFARIVIPPGMHTLQSNSGFTAHVYGFGLTQGYAYSVGSSTLSMERELLVDDIPSSQVSLHKICRDDSVAFEVKVNYDIDSVYWYFGDGNHDEGVRLNHRYIQHGNYDVTAIIKRAFVNCYGNFYDTLNTRIHVGESPVIDDSVTICLHDFPFHYKDSVFISPGNYMVIGKSSLSCDTVFYLCLQSITSYLFETHDTICEGETYHFRGMEISTGGIYEDNFITTNGCDSNYKLILVVNPSYDTLIEDHICIGKHYRRNGFDLPPHPLPGNYEYLKNLKTERGCDSVIALKLYIPETTVNIEVDGDLCEDGYSVLTAHTSNSNILWNTGESTPVIEIVRPGKYSVTVEENECLAIDTVSIEGCPFKLYFPNAISPRDVNGINDYFCLSSTDHIAIFDITIYNRWGNVVFFSADANFRWDGSFRGRVLPGVYTYIIRIKTTEGPGYHYKGSITVL